MRSVARQAAPFSSQLWKQQGGFWPSATTLNRPASATASLGSMLRAATQSNSGAAADAFVSLPKAIDDGTAAPFGKLLLILDRR